MSSKPTESTAEESLAQGTRVLDDLGLHVTSLSETTPLLARAQEARGLAQSVASDPQGFLASYAERVLLWALGPVLERMPAINEGVDERHENHVLEGIFIEVCILIKYSFPSFFAYLQEQSVTLAPIISIGHLSTVSLAATTIATIVANVTAYSVINGLSSALDTVLAPNSTHARFAGFWCTYTAVILFTVLGPIKTLWLSMEAILLGVDQNVEVAHLTSVNLQYTALGIPAFALNEILKRFMVAEGLSSVHTKFMSFAATVNGILNYVLVHGPSSLSLGFAGAPIATAFSYNIVAALCVMYIMCRPRKFHEIKGPRVVLRPSLVDGFKTLLFLGLAGVAHNASSAWSKEAAGFTMSMLGPSALAAQAVLLATSTIVFQVSRSIGESSNQRIKKLVGDGHVRRARQSMIATLGVGLGALVLICNCLLIFCGPWSAIFTNDPVVSQTVKDLLPLLSLYIILHGLGAWIDALLGALNKPAIFPALIVSADYCAGIPLGLWLAFSRKWGLAGMWTGLVVSLAYACVVGSFILVRSAAFSSFNVTEPLALVDEEITSP